MVGVVRNGSCCQGTGLTGTSVLEYVSLSTRLSTCDACGRISNMLRRILGIVCWPLFLVELREWALAVGGASEKV